MRCLAIQAILDKFELVAIGLNCVFAVRNLVLRITQIDFAFESGPRE